MWNKFLGFFKAKPAVSTGAATAAIVAPAAGPVFQEPIKGDPELPAENFQGQVKLGIIVGHEQDAPGAKMSMPYGIYEYFFNKEIAQKMVEYARTKYPNVLTELILRDGIGITGAYHKAQSLLCDVVIELHFNAANAVASGTETLCTSDTNDVEFAHVIHGGVCRLFKREGTKDRGVKALSASARGNINVHSFPGRPNCLVEPFFGDNKEEADFAMQNKDAYARCLVDGVYLWARKVDLIK